MQSPIVRWSAGGTKAGGPEGKAGGPVRMGGRWRATRPCDTLAPVTSPARSPDGPRDGEPGGHAGGWDRKWTGAAAGTLYEGERWTSSAKRERDARLVRALLRRTLVAPAKSPLRILDAPCGTGRLAPALAEFGAVTGLDVSRSMLAAGPDTSARICGDVRHLPFADGAFDAVVCCRLLHHLREEHDAARVLSELVRVSRGLVVVSFWDAGSLPALRRRLWTGARAPRRFARSRARIEGLLEEAGARVLAWRHSLRFVSRQAFVAARRSDSRG